MGLLPATLLLSALARGYASPAPPAPWYLQLFHRNIRVGQLHRVGTMVIIQYWQVAPPQETCATIGAVTRALGQPAFEWPIVSLISFFFLTNSPACSLRYCVEWFDSLEKKKIDLMNSTTWLSVFAGCESNWLLELDALPVSTFSN